MLRTCRNLGTYNYSRILVHRVLRVSVHISNIFYENSRPLVILHYPSSHPCRVVEYEVVVVLLLLTLVVVIDDDDDSSVMAMNSNDS